jgi:hypothetical protein
MAGDRRQGGALSPDLDAGAALDAVLVTMNIMLVSGVQQLLPMPATGLVLLTLLALGTFWRASACCRCKSLSSASPWA